MNAKDCCHKSRLYNLELLHIFFTMNILQYLSPNNDIARWIVFVLLGLFGVWISLLLWNLFRHLSYRRQMVECKDVTTLVQANRAELDATADSYSQVADQSFSLYTDE